jgi:hypothetical protein
VLQLLDAYKPWSSRVGGRDFKFMSDPKALKPVPDRRWLTRSSKMHIDRRINLELAVTKATIALGRPAASIGMIT